jgi:RimJ/RimL family protein N-acetyltransferase
VVRQIELDDHDLLWAAAQRAMPGRGLLRVPSSLNDAIALLGEYDRLRVAEAGNLYGVTEPEGRDLCGVLGLRVSGLVAEAGMWGVGDMRSRETNADGAALLTAYGHKELNLIRIWMDLDELDQFLRRLAVRCGYQIESRTVQEDGHVRIRYSSVGR